jgi:hypothetical protein
VAAHSLLAFGWFVNCAKGLQFYGVRRVSRDGWRNIAIALIEELSAMAWLPLSALRLEHIHSHYAPVGCCLKRRSPLP